MKKSEEQNSEVARKVESLRQQHAQQIVRLQQTIQSQVNCLEEKDQLIKQKDETIAAGLQEDQQLREQFRKEKEDEKNRKGNKILKLTTQLKQVISEKEMAQARVSELESQLRKEDESLVQQHRASNAAKEKGTCKPKWREGKKAMCKISNIFIGEMAATVNGDIVYVMEFTKIYAYNTSTHSWFQLPDSKYEGCALAIVNNLLTLIGGRNHPDKTNKLFGLTERGSVTRWTEEFPSMPTKRYGACALRIESALIVAGGDGEAGTGKLATTEVLNTATLQWSTVVDLPQQMFGGSLLRIGSDSVYLLGAYDRDQHPVKSVYTCSLNALLQSYNPHVTGRTASKIFVTIESMEKSDGYTSNRFIFRIPS